MVVFRNGNSRSVAVNVAPANQPGAEDEIARLLNDLLSNNGWTRKLAADKFAAGPVQANRRAEVAAALLKMTKKGDWVGLYALGTWGTADEVVPFLVERVSDPLENGGLKKGMMEVLGQFRDERAAEPVAAFLGGISSLNGAAMRSLTSMGPAAEKVLIKCLGDKRLGVRSMSARSSRTSARRPASRRSNSRKRTAT